MEIKGYKIFNPDWTCKNKQYTCPGIFVEEGDLIVCKHGMHFCKKLIDCFDYYDFNINNKVAEVVAIGEILEYGNKCCTNCLKIVRELTWDEISDLVNFGEHNIGIENCGFKNHGNQNIGRGNIGNRNIGYYNEGDSNLGDRNIGNYNCGVSNFGDSNNGYNNNGHENVGDWNKTNNAFGLFNTQETTIYLFNKPSNLTFSQFYQSQVGSLLFSMPDLTEVKSSTNSSTKEKMQTHIEITDIEERQAWWDRLSQQEKDIIFSLPNFDVKIFKETTGIDVLKN